MEESVQDTTRLVGIARWLLIALAAFSNWSCGERLPPNIILITADTLRADALRVYGGSCDCTPNLDALARRSLVFQRATTPVGTTSPAHASLFTGLYPKGHGVSWNGEWLLADYTTLAERLSENGYRTTALASWRRLTRDAGLGQGFAETEGEVAAAMGLEGLVAGNVRSADAIFELASRWLETVDDEAPFFLWLHFNEPHAPYPATSYSARVMEELGYEGALEDGAGVEEYYSHQRGGIEPVTRSALRSLYDGRVAELDAVLGRLLGQVEKASWAGRTAIVFTADHGQMAGDRDRVGHAFEIWEPVLRIPLLLALPGVEAAERRDRVTLPDLHDTLLDLAGLQPHHRSHGRSLLGTVGPSRPIFGQTEALAGREDADLVKRSADLVVYLDDLKFIRTREGLRVVDLSRDPHEASPSASIPEEVADRVEQLLDRYAALVPQSGRAARSPSELGAELEAELRSLGYLP